MEAAALEVDGIKVAYGLSEIIESLSFALAKREIVALMGLNGMGKTTLMKTLIGILPAQMGHVHVGGVDVTPLRPHIRVAAGLAYVPQGRMVFPTLTVEENIEAGLAVGRKSVPPYLYELFPVLREMRGRRAGNLSGGQQQQLVIARALASDPRVLLLDEPTEGIQPSIIKELAVTLRRIRDTQDVSILVSEQVLSFAVAVADRVLVLNRGRIVYEATREEVDEERLKAVLSI